MISVPEETRVIESRPQHTFVPSADDAVGVAVQVRHGDKVRLQPAVFILDGEVLLMVIHHRFENFLGQSEVSFFESPENRRRVFSNVDQRGQQPGVGADTLACRDNRCNFSLNLFPAIGGRENDEIVGQLRAIIGGAGDFNRS